MGHWAKIENDIVTNVIVAEEDFIQTLDGEWIQTSYNTHLGKHPNGTPLRKNFAGIGYEYNRVLDAFIPMKPFESWVLDEDLGVYKAPIEKPNDDKVYHWNESELNWIEI